MADARPRQLLRPYGDRRDDGVVQLSFALPVAPSEKAKEAAVQFIKKLGFQQVLIAAMEPAGNDFSFFVAYGRTAAAIDFNTIEVPEVIVRKLGFDEINAAIAKQLGRKIVVVGACTGSDAHTVGIDAILNYKGFAGEKGLESYKCFDAHNLGAQVENSELAERAKALGADVILVSQVITQRNCHKENGRALVELLEREGWRSDVILLFGGPRVDHQLALELGFDAGFGPGTKPADVASYLVDRLCGQTAT
jgi:beta-lysine 5,6-aminomutase beta subunit